MAGFLADGVGLAFVLCHAGVDGPVRRNVRLDWAR